MEQKEFDLVLCGLDCAHCAGKIEEHIREIKAVQQADVSLASQKVRIRPHQESDREEIIRQVKKIVHRIEPEVEVQEKGKVKGEEETQAEKTKIKRKLWRLGIGMGVFIGALLLEAFFILQILCYIGSYLLIGGDILWRALKNISRGQIFDENFLMAIATLGAFGIGEYPEAVAVMLFYQVGELFQDLAVNRSRKSIRALMDIRPDFAHLKTAEEIKTVDPEEVGVGATIIVRPGEKIPLDGIVTDGTSQLDTSALTGESIPRTIKVGEEVLSGAINQTGVLTIKVTKTFGESTVSKILDLVENASTKKAPTENFITKFARYYTPAVVFAALALAVLPPLLIQGEQFGTWVARALIFLVVSCPCALVVSIPLGFFGGIGAASRRGILIKGGNYLEALKDVNTVIFDKTGTLTKGVFGVVDIVPEGGYTKEELLQIGAYAEAYSNHPIAKSILQAYGEPVHLEQIQEYTEVAGHGVQVHLEGRSILAGNQKMMEQANIQAAAGSGIGTIVHIAVDGAYIGHILIADEIKPDSKEAVEGLKKKGIRQIAMLTGDRMETAKRIAKELGIETVFAELLPGQKVEKLELLDSQKGTGKLAFIGDGINDAPVLARADIGIAMGGVGSDAAIEAADIVLMTDEPAKIVEAIAIARRTNAIVWQNIVFALGVKVLVLVLGALGFASMWAAVFADVGVALIAVLNALRIIQKVEK